MKVIINDGGREAAGFKGKTGDCVTRAISIAMKKDYKDVYTSLFTIAKLDKKVKNKSPRNGVPRRVYDKYIKACGWEWVPCMGIGTRCTVHLNENELPKGRLIVRLSKHLTAVINGEIHDTFDPQRHGFIVENGESRPWQRCVYGYYIKKGMRRTK